MRPRSRSARCCRAARSARWSPPTATTSSRSATSFSSGNGWREWFVSNGGDIQKLEPAPGTQIHSYLGALGMPGLTAYAGLLRIGALKEGERVFVSAASGAVGSIACQIAKAKGCYVVGSVGSDEKAAHLLEELGVDKAINYKTCGELNAAVGAAFPDGIDVYFENVGGKHLEAALYHMRPFGRIPFCGMIDMYNAEVPPPGPNNLALIIGLQLTVRGFLVSTHYDMMADFQRDYGEVDQGGQDEVARDHSRRHRARAGSLHRPLQGRQFRQDAGAGGTGQGGLITAPDRWRAVW